MKFTTFKAVASAAILLVAGSAMAQRRPLPLNSELQRVTPLRMAKVDGYGRLKGPWIPVSQGIDMMSSDQVLYCMLPGASTGLAAAPAMGAVAKFQGPTFEVAFDCFEADATGAPTELPAYGPAINGANPGQRYSFTGGNNPFCCNDMTVAPGKAGALATRVDLAWKWDGAVGERCILIVNTAEDFGATSAGPSFGTPYDGVAYDFGTALTPNSFYRSRPADLTGTLNFKMPVDGTGAYIITIANFLDASGSTLASTAQPMLWLTKINNPSFQGPNQWDDDNPIDHMHTAPDEFYDYNFETISDRPLGAMIAFYAVPSTVTVVPSSYQIFRGFFVSGNVASLATSDNDYLKVKIGIVLDPNESPVDVNITGTSSVLNPTSMTFTLESSANTIGLRQTTSLFNVTTNAWEQIDQRSATTTDATNTFTISTNAARFVAANGTVRARMQYKQVGPVSTNNWQVSLDRTAWDITP